MLFAFLTSQTSSKIDCCDFERAYEKRLLGKYLTAIKTLKSCIHNSVKFDSLFDLPH